MNIYEFAKQVWESCIDSEEFTLNGYTVQDAAVDLENFRAAGWEMPDDITSEELAAAVNDVTAEAQAQDAE